MAMAIAEPVWTLGDRMWKARKLAGLEQIDVAKKIGVSRALVSRWERDLSDPGTRQLREFAELTGVGTEWLLATGYMPTSDDPASGYKHDGACLDLLTGGGKAPRRKGFPLLNAVETSSPL